MFENNECNFTQTPTKCLSLLRYYTLCTVVIYSGLYSIPIGFGLIGVPYEAVSVY